MLCKENIDDNPDPTVNKIGVPTHLQLLDLAPIKYWTTFLKNYNHFMIVNCHV